MDEATIIPSTEYRQQSRRPRRPPYRRTMMNMCLYDSTAAIPASTTTLKVVAHRIARSAARITDHQPRPSAYSVMTPHAAALPRGSRAPLAAVAATQRPTRPLADEVSAGQREFPCSASPAGGTAGSTLPGAPSESPKTPADQAEHRSPEFRMCAAGCYEKQPSAGVRGMSISAFTQVRPRNKPNRPGKGYR